jgi:TrmH family RNA methyltransferase
VPVPPDARLSSRQHPVVRRFRRAANGEEPGVVLLDGPHLVTDALAAGVPIDTVLSDARSWTLAERARASGAVAYEAAASVLDAASPVRTPTGIVALARWTPATFDRAFAGQAACIVALAGVQDPGNAGAAIRAADALGATGVLALEGTADPASWKCLRGAMGSTFRIPVAVGSIDDALAAARGRKLIVVASVAGEGTAVDRVDLTAPAVLFLGSEGAGLPDRVVAAADLRVAIPMKPGVDSLNVATTTAILLFEARRQRQGS